MFLGVVGSIKTVGMEAHTCCQLWLCLEATGALLALERDSWLCLNDMNSACVAFAACHYCLPPTCHPWGHVSLTVRHCLSLTSGLLLCNQRGLSKAHVLSCPFFKSFYTFHYSRELYTAWATAKPSPLLSHLFWLLAPALLNSLLV